MKLMICVVMLALAGCASSMPTRTAAGNWEISSEVAFTGPGGALQTAIAHANTFCQSRGQVAKLVANSSKDCMLHGGCGEAEVTFICGNP